MVITAVARKTRANILLLSSFPSSHPAAAVVRVTEADDTAQRNRHHADWEHLWCFRMFFQLYSLESSCHWLKRRRERDGEKCSQWSQLIECCCCCSCSADYCCCRFRVAPQPLDKVVDACCCCCCCSSSMECFPGYALMAETNRRVGANLFLLFFWQSYSDVVYEL